jgi:predicted TIM-barrel enzyme
MPQLSLTASIKVDDCEPLVCGTDPFRDIPRFLAQLKEMGFSGVQNFPTVVGLSTSNIKFDP